MSFEWSDECPATFEDLKKYLGSPLLLSKLVIGEELYMYVYLTICC